MRVPPVCLAALMLALTTHGALAQSAVRLSIAGEAYDGAPEFEVRFGDAVVGTGAVETAIDTVRGGRLFNAEAPRQYFQSFTFEIPEAAFDPAASIGIVLTNDRYEHIGDGYDRNLFIEYVDVNGLKMVGEAITIIEYGSVIVDVPLHEGLRPVYGSGQVAIAAPPEEGWPAYGATDVANSPPPPPRPDNR